MEACLPKPKTRQPEAVFPSLKRRRNAYSTVLTPSGNLRKQRRINFPRLKSAQDVGYSKLRF
jgi:hypothetical protein